MYTYNIVIYIYIYIYMYVVLDKRGRAASRPGPGCCRVFTRSVHTGVCGKYGKLA